MAELRREAMAMAELWRVTVLLTERRRSGRGGSCKLVECSHAPRASTAAVAAHLLQSRADICGLRRLKTT
eukprot:6913508-Prymnesium_polylepis.1